MSDSEEKSKEGSENEEEESEGGEGSNKSGSEKGSDKEGSGEGSNKSGSEKGSDEEGESGEGESGEKSESGSEKDKESEKDKDKDKDKDFLKQTNEIKIDITPFNSDFVEQPKTSLQLLQDINKNLNSLYNELKIVIPHFGEERNFDFKYQDNGNGIGGEENFNFDFEFMKNIQKKIDDNLKSPKGHEIGVQSQPVFSSRKKIDENIQVSFPENKTDDLFKNTEPKIKPKIFKEEEIQSSQEDLDAIPKKNNLLRSSASSLVNKQKSNSQSKYRTVEDLYQHTKGPIIYSKDPYRGNKIKSYHQLNQSLNKKFAESDSKQVFKNNTGNQFFPNQNKPNNLKQAMNILLDQEK